MSKIKCPKCGGESCISISRVVGYFSKVPNWNKAKLAEKRDREKGDYHIEKSSNAS